MIRLFVPGKLINPMNRKQHWAQRARWAKEWRRMTHLQWLREGRPTWSGGRAHVVITACVARPVDLGAIGPMVKPVEDEGLFRMLGGIERVTRTGQIQRIAPDGPGDGHVIEHRAAVVAERGVRIEIEEA